MNPLPLTIKEQFNNIIEEKQIKTVFQPIVSLRDTSILGYEALSRLTKNIIIQNPDELFSLATQYNRLWDLELLCRTKALEAAHKLLPNEKLFLNVNPNVIHDIKFKEGFTKEYLEKYAMKPENIIFEITERNAIKDIIGFRSTITHYKQQNYKIAIDDAGAGYSGLNLICDVKPHYIKLDMNLIRNIDTDSIKYALVKSMIELSKLSNIHLIAEGIERIEELSTLVTLGVQYGQGYFIQKPQETISPIDTCVINTLQKLNQQRNHLYTNSLSYTYIGNLCKEEKTVDPASTVEDVYSLFLSNPSLLGVCVIKNKQVIGVVTRTLITTHLSGRYGFSLNQKKTISTLMQTKFLSVDYQTSINTVAKLAMSRSTDKLYDFITITHNNNYLGIVTVKELLEKAMEVEVTNAKQLNPLSGLPGNLVIDQKLAECLCSGSPFSALYFDLDNFKAYNDVYGFGKGDIMLKLLTQIIITHKPPNGFAGHIGGDDFIMILPFHDCTNLCEQIISDFEVAVRKCYTEEDLKNGYIASKNRHGILEKFPIATLSIAAITNQNTQFDNMNDFSAELAKLKKKCKQQDCSICYIC
ncbi:GGDEF domain-containing protein [Cellulosilyticum sp. I15G10I2]|uniref:GGDEF domain-containing protein n=1 Tax=Cellulosilyticum sp. I15G10I2 TaxID=1892843 RepID=UPI00085BEBF7|nr:GGDEF domain-containing protein [Cellulosilyticum sp. I15G10I2]